MNSSFRAPLLDRLYQQYLVDQDVDVFVNHVARRYTVGSLERLLAQGQRSARRAAALALGMLGDYSSNAALGNALRDEDRGVRLLVETGIRSLWCRTGSRDQRRRLQRIIRLNATRRPGLALAQATALIENAPWMAEAWNQRTMAAYSLGNFDDAIRDCRQALELNPYHFGAAAGMGQCHLQLNNRNLALECFRRALHLNPNLEGVRGHVVQLQRILKNRE